MFERKHHMYIDSDERRIMLISLNNLRTSLISQGRYTDIVDEMIYKIVNLQSKLIKSK